MVFPFCLVYVHFDEVIIETDAEQVVKCLRNQIKVSEISNVILDCLALLAELEKVKGI